jgi:hypothetical protein
MTPAGNPRRLRLALTRIRPLNHHRIATHRELA